MNSLVVFSCLVALAAAKPGYLGAPAAVLSTPAATALAAPAIAYAAPAAAVVAAAAPVAYAAPAPAVVAAAGPVAYAAPAPAVVAAAPGSTVVTAPGTSAYSFSTQSVHPPQVVPASPQTAYAAAIAAAPVLAAAPAIAAAPAVVAAAPAAVFDAPEVVAARAAHFQAHVAAKAALLGRKKRSPGILSPAAPVVLSTPAATALAAHVAPVAYAAHAAPVAYAAHVAAVAPVAYSAPAVAYSAPAAVAYSAPAPVAYAAPAAAAVLPVTGSSQYRVQDAIGQYTYGYADGNSAKTESRAVDGSTFGGYSYVDGHGLVQSVKYHADSLGFRVAGTNLPVGPA